VESSGDAIITKSLDGIITSWNKGAEQIYGYSAEEVVGKPISILEPSILVEETAELAELIKQGDKIHNYETLRLRKDGTIINVSLTLSPIYDASGELTAISAIARDITKSKNVEKELQQSEERYRIVTEQTGQMVYDYDLRTSKNKFAGAIEEVTGYNFEEFQKLGKDFWTENILDSDPNRVYKKVQDKKTGARFKEELRLRRKDGTYGYIENSGVYLMDNDGQPYRAIGVLRDITEKREAEEALEKTDKMRIKEIHHRIKNNLQVISSLLDLQVEKFKNREYIKDSEILEAFRESQDRVLSIALIHEELYKGEGLETLNFSLYINKLGESLFQTYKLGNTVIDLNMDMEENLFFDMDIAVPLGIIVNELVSNSLKHAFTGRTEGKIQIKFQREKSENDKSTIYTMTVSDNGVGIPENINIEKLDSLGMQLVTSLVDQLDGEFELKRNNGTEFIIRFTVKER
jgi:PAS domain S-box-containing protein